MSEFFGAEPIPPTNACINEACIDSDDQRSALDKFARLYMAGLAGYLRSARHISEEDSEEIVNHFLQDRITNVLAKWDASRPFRPFLKRCLLNYANDILKSRSKDSGTAGDYEEIAEPQRSAVVISDVQLAACEIAVWLRAARDRTMAELRQVGPPLLGVFEAFVVGPIWKGQPCPPHKELGRICGIPKISQVPHYVRRVKRVFVENVQQVIRELSADTDVREEMDRISEMLFDPTVCVEIVHALKGNARKAVDEMETLASLLVPEKLEAEDVGQIRGIVETLLQMQLTENVNGDERRTIGDVLSHPNLHVDYWYALKRQVKQMASKTNERVPREVLKAFYLASIAGGILRGERMISQKRDDELRADFRTALSQVWLTTDIRRLIHEAWDSLSN